jgi:hypothetical protein
VETGGAGTGLLSAVGVLDHESLDRVDFPRSGADLRGRLEWGISDATTGGWFTSTIVDGKLYIPLHQRLTLDGAVYAGYARGPDLPPQRRFFLGGTYRSAVFRDTHPTFPGFGVQSRSGRAVQVGSAGLRFEVRPDWFLRAGVDVAAIQDDWELPLPDALTAWTLGGGLRTRIGPIVGQVSMVDGSDARFSVTVGRSF